MGARKNETVQKKKERKKEERQWEKARTGAKALAGQRFPISYQFM